MGVAAGGHATRHAAHLDEVVHSEEADEEDDEASQQQNQPVPNTPGCCVASRMQHTKTQPEQDATSAGGMVVVEPDGGKLFKNHIQALVGHNAAVGLAELRWQWLE